MLALGVPAYFLYAVLAAGLGIIAGDSQQAQQLASMLGLIGLVPLWLAGVLVTNSNGPLAVALTLFPLTSPMVSLIRMTLTTVPDWQLGLALALIIVSLLLSVWFVVRIFRAAMLLYGQALRPRAVWQALRAA
jgi:ABC-2 type transport system permease protein